MILVGKAESVVAEIVHAFENPNLLPKPLVAIFIHRKDSVPCRSWSWRNQLIIALRGHTDARGFRQWEHAGRRVKKGEKACYILSPVTKAKIDQETGEKRTVVIGFKGIPVFGYDQTKGDALPVGDQSLDAWVKSLPLVDVASSWGVKVEAIDGRDRGPLGVFWRSGEQRRIKLAVKNLSTWAHEMVHAADHRNDNLTELGQHWKSETVAELGGAVLLRMLGFDHEADLGGCWEYIQQYAKRAGINVIDACGKVLDRTCEAVACILDAAEKLKDEEDMARMAQCCA